MTGVVERNKIRRMQRFFKMRSPQLWQAIIQVVAFPKNLDGSETEWWPVVFCINIQITDSVHSCVMLNRYCLLPSSAFGCVASTNR